jgi:SAM-dependent methyltransferase
VTHGSVDIAYARNFVKELSPGLMRAAAALSGVSPPPAERFDYCEIGCGNGDTICALAAAYPDATFLGVDLSAEHVEFARSLAERAEVANVRFVQGDFEELARDGVAPLAGGFHYVCAHGVLSWVPADKRRALIAAASGVLRAGGLFYVGHNTMPGWAAVEPMRRLMLDTSTAAGGDLASRVRYGLGVARLFSDGGAEYFAANQAAREMLATALRAGVGYAAHEYFVEEWHPLYFADLAEEMYARGLAFAGSMPLFRGVPELVVPPGLREAFGRVADRTAFESLKDFATNAFFRTDVWVKGDGARSETVARNYVDATTFGTLVATDAVKREVRLGHDTLRFDGPAFDALVPRLAAGRATIAELSADPALAPLGVDALRRSVLELAYGEQAWPMRAGRARASSSERLRVPLPYNRFVLEQRLSGHHPIVLAAPAAATAITLSMLHAVVLRALTEADDAARTEWIHALLQKQTLRLWVRDRAVDDKDEQARVIADETAPFLAKRVPKLAELGIVEA